MICSKCKIDKPLGEMTKNKTRKSGYGGECKQCVRERANKNYHSNPEKYRNRTKVWQKNNPEKTKQSLKNWKIKNRDWIVLYDKEYRKNNEEVHAKARQRLKVWVENNPERHQINKRKSSNKRRALKQGCKTKITSQEINQLIKDSNNICFWCDSYTEKIHLDHITPLSKGGDDTIYNLVISCPQCNLKKSDKDPETWLDEILNEKLLRA